MFETTEFTTELFPGSVKAAMKAAGASSRDLWFVDVDKIKIIDGFNVRVKDESYAEHIRSIADSIKAEGFYLEKALAGYVSKEGNEQVIYITDGHCRLEAALLAKSEGAEIDRLPVVVNSHGANMEDLTVALVKSNTGKRLTTYETSVVCKRLSRFGWDADQIAKRLGFVKTYVDGLLLLASAPLAVREMVQNGKVSASNAIQALHAEGSKAAESLQAALERAQDSGAKKVTAKHLPGSTFKKEVKKCAPAMFDLLSVVKGDAGYNHLSEEIRAKLEELIGQLEATKEKETLETPQSSIMETVAIPIVEVETISLQEEHKDSELECVA